MKAFMRVVAGIGFLALTTGISAAENADLPKSNRLDRYRRQIGDLVKQYYPEAIISASYDEKLKADKIHFEYNTQLIVMRFRNKDGSWQEPQEVIGPFVGGIWCDLVLEKGRYKGDVEDAEQGVTEAGPDFYSYFVTPYSKKKNQYIAVKLRYPGGTPPEFLKRFAELAKDFERFVDKPDEK